MEKETKNLMKIGELAAAAGVSVTTVKYYVKEGLIRPARKTGRNMAWYDPACVSTIGTIRLLQRERYYPLSVIKRLLSEPAQDGMSLELLDAIHKVDYHSSAGPVPLADAARRTRLTTRQIGTLTEAGLVRPEIVGRRKFFREEDLGVMALVRRRMDAGIPFRQSIRSFVIYEKALRQAVEADVDVLATAMVVPSFTAESGAQMIRMSDETLDAFVALRRKALNREFGSRMLGEIDRFTAALKKALPDAAAAFSEAGLAREAGQLGAVLSGEKTGEKPLDEAADYYCGRLPERGGIAESIAGAARSRDYFMAPAPEADASPALLFLRAAWLTLAPEILGCKEAAAAARRALTAALETRLGTAGRALGAQFGTILAQTGGMI